MAVDQKGYRRYHATVERALALFDANSDWADHIAFLSRLLKSLESGKPEGLSDIPCKTRIALCLSRCLQPSLPSGVHQKALSVYSEVFSIIGVRGLSQDLSLYLPGLSHTLAFANLSTRPMVLDLYEGYILKLSSSALRPALKALLLSLLPVIEEETSEDFDRCLHTFEMLKACFSKDDHEYFFWQTLFVASVSNPLRRAGVLVYLTRYLPKLTPKDRQHNDSAHQAQSSDVIITPEPGLLVRCFATGLRDEQTLVQRGFLDLLVTHLPLSADILQAERYRKDLDVLVLAALMVVLRRDMSLNRRLWAWFTGYDSKSSDVLSPKESVTSQSELESDYFTIFGLASIIRGIQSMIANVTELPGPRTLPFRIMLSLMDRWQIGGPVVKASFASMMKSLMAYQSSAPSQTAFDEVFRSANVFFDGIESATLFGCMTELLRLEETDLLIFIVSNFNIEQTDMIDVHVTELIIHVAEAVVERRDQAMALVSLLNDLTAIVGPTSLVTGKTARPEVSTKVLDAIVKTLCFTLEMPENGVLLPSICTSFERAVILSPTLSPVAHSDLLEIFGRLLSSSRTTTWEEYAVADACSKVLGNLLTRLTDMSSTMQKQLFSCLPDLVSILWSLLDPSTPQFHVVAVEDIWRLQDLSEGQGIVESTILSLLGDTTAPFKPTTEAQIQRFSTLYHHTKTVKRNADDSVPHMLRRSILRIIDTCRGEDRSEPGVRWLTSLASISPVLKILFDTQLGDMQNRLLTMARVQKLIKILYLSEDYWRSFSTSTDIQSVCEFCLQLIDSEHHTETILRDDAFGLLRRLYGTSSGNSPPDQLVSLLVDKLDQSLTSSAPQEQVLDTLLVIINDKSLLPSSLVQVLLRGLSTIPVDDRLDKWITLLCNFLPNHVALLPSLLKVTSGFCKRIEETFDDMQMLFSQKRSSTSAKNPEKSIANLLLGLEYVLARAHQQAFHTIQANSQLASATTQEPISSRSRANDRLTVILCMQDAIRICARLWSWKSAGKTSNDSDAKSFQYTAMKLRSRSRKIMENLIEAEPQECLETLVGLWSSEEQSVILDLLQTLNGARPRSMMPAVFNAIYSRSNPGALSSSQKSSLSIPIGAIDLVVFLNDYTSALEDDMLEEIWTDCATFLREVLANPMPHRQILIKLLRFCSTLSRKMENTNFSGESRMQRELADICTRLFTAIFTIKPTGFDGVASLNGIVSRAADSKQSEDAHGKTENMLSLLVDTLPHLGPLLSQYDRSNTVFAGIASNITSPSFHARAFPQNLTIEHLEVMQLMSSSSKTWKKELLDGINNPKFFQSSTDLAGRGWLPLIKQLLANDKSIMAEWLNRLTPPAAAGIMLGIGASTARTEADRRTQLDLRKTTTAVLASDVDTALPHLPLILQKIEELFSATVESSPSLASRGDVYLLIRALLLKTNHSNLAQLWPILDAELQSLCRDLLAGSESKYPAFSKMQGAKLLDLLLVMRPDEFQLHEWLFVTDTIDAIYPPSTFQPQSYADEVASLLNTNGAHLDTQTNEASKMRRPWLYGDESRELKNVDTLLAGFFRQMSIRVFEDLYSLQLLDREACWQDLLADVFTDVTAWNQETKA